MGKEKSPISKQNLITAETSLTKNYFHIKSEIFLKLQIDLFKKIGVLHLDLSSCDCDVRGHRPESVQVGRPSIERTDAQRMYNLMGCTVAQVQGRFRRNSNFRTSEAN